MPKKSHAATISLQFYVVDFHWSEPDKPPTELLSQHDPSQPFVTEEIMAVPQREEMVSVLLPFPQSSGLIFEPTPITVSGRVTAVKIDESQKTASVTLERVGRVGLTWYELGACIGAEMIAYLPPVGRVEGRLEALLPRCELACLHVPGIHEVSRQFLNRLQTEGVDISEFEAEDEDEDILWVPWSTIWPKGSIEMMRSGSKKAPKKRS